MIRLFLVDDHPIVRSGIRAMLADEPGLQVVGEANHGQELLSQLATIPADVVLLDVNMPVLDGLATTQRLRTEFPDVRVLVLSMLSHERYVGQLLEAGALGYALKNDALPEIVAGIRRVATGQQYLCSELSLLMLRKVLAKEPSSPERPARNPYNFSSREIEVLHLLADGLTTNQIAEKLFASKRTIEAHRQNMLDKSNAKNVAVLIRLAIAQGLLC